MEMTVLIIASICMILKSIIPIPIPIPMMLILIAMAIGAIAIASH